MKNIFLFIFLSSCVTHNSLADIEDPKIVESIDLNKYSGKWFEIARYPTFFQRNCIYSTAEYKVLTPDSVEVYNVCYKEDKSTSDISGKATVADPRYPAKLKVRFNFFAQGDYWVIDLDPDYRWAVVSSAKKQSLFVLARQAPMDAKILSEIIEKLKSRGFDTEKIIYDQYKTF